MSELDLLARGGVYRELYETQFRQVLDYEAAHGEEPAPESDREKQ